MKILYSLTANMLAVFDIVYYPLLKELFITRKLLTIFYPQRTIFPSICESNLFLIDLPILKINDNGLNILTIKLWVRFLHSFCLKGNES